jgi:hypothetical protein
VHLHSVIRIDRAMPDYRRDEIHPPDPRFTSRLLEHAVGGALEAVSAPIAEDLAVQLGEQRVRWGQERDVRPIDDAGELAGYLAKYSTKSTEQAGGLLHPIDAESVESAAVSEHVRGYLHAAFKLHDLAHHAADQRRSDRREEYRREHAAQQPTCDCVTRRDGAASVAWRARQALGRGETVRVRQLDGTEHTGQIERITTTQPRPDTPDETLLLTMAGGETIHLADIDVVAPPPPPERKAALDRADPRLAANAHKLGYRGHCLTKSRRWSTTFMALRQERERHVREQLVNGPGVAESQRRLAELDSEQRITRMEFAGVGHLTTADAYLAAQAAAQARERRRLAREALAERREIRQSRERRRRDKPSCCQ